MSEAVKKDIELFETEELMDELGRRSESALLAVITRGDGRILIRPAGNITGILGLNVFIQNRVQQLLNAKLNESDWPAKGT